VIAGRFAIAKRRDPSFPILNPESALLAARIDSHYRLTILVTTKAYLIGAALVVLLAAALRLYNLGGTSLWFDEAVYANISNAPWDDFLRATRSSNSSPIVLPGILWLFSEIIYDSYWIRFFPALFGIATVIVLLLLPATGLPKSTSLLAALWLAVLPVHIQYSQEVREYSLSTFVSALLLLAFLAASNKQASLLSQCGFALVLFFAPLCSYGTILVSGALLTICWGMQLLENRFAPKAAFGLFLALLGGLACSYLLTARDQMQVAKAWYLVSDYPSSDWMQIPYWFAKANGKYFLFIFGGALPALVALLALFTFVAVMIKRNKFNFLEAHIVYCFLLLVFGSIVFAFLGLYPYGGLRQHLFAVPIALVAVSSAAVWLCQASGLGRARCVRTYAVAILVVCISYALYIPNAYREVQDVIRPVLDIDQTHEDATVWVYYSSVPAVRFHHPEKAFVLSTAKRGQVSEMAEEISEISSEKVYLLFSHMMLKEDTNLVRSLSARGYIVLRDTLYNADKYGGAGSRLVLLQVPARAQQKTE
jgi:uncharacterized membrane protein